MPDISMCSGEGCPFREKCYRNTAEPSEYLQSWFATAPYNAKTDTCDYLWDNSNYRKRESDAGNIQFTSFKCGKENIDGSPQAIQSGDIRPDGRKSKRGNPKGNTRSRSVRGTK